jgi:hypothetical protein
MTDKDAMAMAIDALEESNTDNDTMEFWDRKIKAIAALKERLADPMREVQRLGQEIEQEPVAWMRKMFSPELGEFFDYKDGAFANETYSEGWTPLYTTPPQRTWVGLTDEDCKRMSAGDRVVAIWADRTLKEKNT